MKTLQLIFKTGLMMAFVGILSFSLASCGEDEPVSGCTDPDADNYSENAETDDGTCTYFDRFTGTWSGTFSCAGPLSALFASADLKIDESVSADNDVVSVVVTSTQLPFPIPLTGTITKNSLSIDEEIKDVVFATLFPDGFIFDIKAAGTLNLTNATTLDGSLNFQLVETSGLGNASGAIPGGVLPDQCGFTATK